MAGEATRTAPTTRSASRRSSPSTAWRRSRSTRWATAGEKTVGGLFCLQTPPLANGGPDPVLSTNPCPFRENLPLRNQPPVVNDVAGAIPIQEEIERVEWADQSGDPVAYAPHLRKALVLFSFAQGDPVVTNTT